MDALAAPVAPAKRRRSGRPVAELPKRLGWLAGALALLVLALVVVAWRQPVADRLWPQNRAQQMRLQADAALQAGRLSVSDGSGARELYEASLAIDPDRIEGRQGLAAVAQAALAQARAAVTRDDFAQAHASLRLARELAVPSAPADAVAEALRVREAALAGLDTLMARAAQARREGRLIGAPDAALPLYRRILSLQPDMGDALREREDTLTDVLEEARAALRDGDLAAAVAGVVTARIYDPGHVDLPDTLARLTEETDAVRRRADADLARGGLADATTRYRRLLAMSPEDEAATRGLAHVAAQHAAQAERLAADFAFVAAAEELARASAAAPAAPEIAIASGHLSRARQAQAQLAPSLPAAERARRVRALLAEAADAEARGDLLAPPGESAYDKLRAARALAPANASVRTATARVLQAARSCFESGLRGNDLGRARACLDARATLGDEDVAMAAARRRLAQRWIAIGDERLGAGDLRGASAALASARGVDPSTPDAAAFAERLRAAGGSRP